MLSLGKLAFESFQMEGTFERLVTKIAIDLLLAFF